MPTLPRPGQKTAMISSTSLDLPEHRKQVVEACLRRSVHPLAMEHLPGRDDDAITVDTESVDKADIYIGIYAWRYGEVPEGSNISYTELEFNRAVERGIPILVFTIHKDHALTIDMVETDANAQKKLAEFKERACKGRIRKEFKSPDDLRGLVIDALADLALREQQASGETPAPSFHRHYDIPEAPEPFIAHPYTLLQTRQLVGRQAELNLLTDWVAKPDAEVFAARILNIVALGGVGKSALTWHWFNEIAPQEMKPMAGRMWWSFYESDARFENFVARALAYVTRRPMADIEAIPLSDRESQLLVALDREPFLIVLDGMERLLIAYARMDAAYLDAGAGARTTSSAWPADFQSARHLENIHSAANSTGAGLADGTSTSQPADGNVRAPAMRKTADPRVGNFLRKLAGVKASRILVSTRLHPADLENKVNGDPLPGCFRRDLAGLADDDALELWRKFNVTGARDQLLPIFNRVENHPLLIQALAGEVARFRRAPGDFEAWQKAHHDFNPFQDLPLVQVKSHVLEFAMRGLSGQARQVLWTISAFRAPASYDTLIAVTTGEGKLCTNEHELDVILTELEDRELLGWDQCSNRYDLHPLVRGVVWSGLGDELRRGVYINLHEHFKAVPMNKDWREINSLDDLTPVIELYNTLIGLERYEDAWQLYRYRLFGSLQFRLSKTAKQIELLGLFFPNGIQVAPQLPDSFSQNHAYRYLAESLHRCGQPKQAILAYVRCIGNINKFSNVGANVGVSVPSMRILISHLEMLADAYHLTGQIYQSHLAVYSSLILAQKEYDFWEQAVVLSRIGLFSAARGDIECSERSLHSAYKMFNDMQSFPREGGVCLLLAQLKLRLGEPKGALSLSNRAWKLAHHARYERDFIRAARVQGAAALGLGHFSNANERLHHALTRARQVNLAEEELPALIALAELRRLQNQPAEARELLDDVWEAAERGPYPLFHADAMNVLTQLERDAGNTSKAIEAATQAYRLAWCDGPPYAYHWGLEAARKHLRELGAPEPEMPPFDPSKFEPMPEVEINPKDEFYVEIGEEESA